MCDRPGHQSYRKGCRCDECVEIVRAYARQQYQKRRDKVLAQKREYHAANREDRLAKMRAYYQANREDLLAKAKAWSLANPERRAANLRAWQRANPERVNAISQAYRARKLDADHGCVTVDAWGWFYTLDCAYCGQPAAQVDHVHPLSKGGLHCVENLAPACASCNRAKRDTILEEAERPLPYLICELKEKL
jgi:5-methylcytosine-specific restriction endonuclease McrA